MPFEPPYRPFTSGDLVLARADGRNGLVEFFRAGQAVPAGRDTPLTPDDFDDFLVPEADLASASRAFHAAVRRLPKSADLFDPQHPPAFRRQRRGKAVLAWSAFGEGPCVHVSLAGIDEPAAMRQVAEKSADEDDPPGPATAAQRHSKVRSMIGSELRWLFRHRRVTAVRARVQFWRPAGDGFAPCPAPWEWADDSGAAWQAYHPKREYTDLDVPVDGPFQPTQGVTDA